MNTFVKTVSVVILLASSVFGAAAQDHSAHGAHAASESASTAAYREANMRMHAEMEIEFTDNADADFVLGMIPHHQGAVEMARIVLEFGTDPEVRAFAENIIAAQEAEISWMKDWLARNGF